MGEYRAEIVSTRSAHFSQIIASNQDNPKKLFHSINNLLDRKNIFNVSSSVQLCNRFLVYFSNKIEVIRDQITTTHTSVTSIVKKQRISQNSPL